jgi:hypothetical protein
MARKAEGRRGWDCGAGAQEKGHRDVQPVARSKDATWDEMLRFFDSLHQHNLPVQPVAQRQAVESLRESAAPAHGGAQIVSTKPF